MVKQKKKSFRKNSAGPEQELLHFLDIISVKGIKEAQAWRDQFLSYHASYYSELAYQRSRIIDDLKNAVREVTIRGFAFLDWNRLVDYQWSLEPLSAKGSTVDPIGGRFNIGDIDRERFPAFPALYLAKNQETCIIEKFGGKDQHSLDQALKNSDSFSLVKLQGELEFVFDLRNSMSLKSFFNSIREIKFPSYLIKTAKMWGFKKPRTVRSVNELFKTMFEKNWRFHPMQCDIPSNSQIFGQIVESVDIQGILYKSVKNQAECLAIFPRNFANTGSYVQLVDKSPRETTIRRLDNTTWERLT